MKNQHLATSPGHLASILTQSELFVRYREAFRLMFGPPLHLVSPEDRTDRRLADLPFATRLSVPVTADGIEACHLRTEPFRPGARNERFDSSARRMLDAGCTAAGLRAAHACFMKLPVISPPRAHAAEVMLQIFAIQLGEFAEKVFIQDEPPPVRRARGYIMTHLAHSIALEDVALHAGVSLFHFCKIFKRATGLTFTRFVNQARIDVAKRLLTRPQARVSEIAFDVGYQSLSQFHRNFRRITGQSPTEYRHAIRRSPITGV